MVKVITDEKKIEELLARSVAAVYPSREALKKELMSGRQLRVYNGIDPTGTYVHIGHSTNYIVLKRFHELGHKVTVVIGDFTATIGDPSDKTAARVRLSHEEVKKNLATYKDQVGKILDLEDKKNPVEFRFNADWLGKLSFADVIELASNFTLQQMIERDIFEKRIKEKKPLYLHEFFYPLMQGYDSVAIETDVEVGGTDQTFNMLAGRTLVRKYQNREKFVLATTLLENPKTGEKLMSKSLGTGVGLNDPADEMFGKIMAIADDGVAQCFVDCTLLSVDEIEKIKKGLASGANPRDAKMKLAEEIVRMYHGEKEAVRAREWFVATFQKRETPTDIPEVRAKKGDLLADILISAKFVKSKSEFRRLIDEGAIDFEGATIKDSGFKVTESGVCKIGKHRFLRASIS